ncbi:MFS transporter [Parafrankia discariae]|uniref:MFS transporter n=1 Tax=Parafrankia discariae TaxID=365528 RepID=UPI00039FE5FE|nr:MFS transporter [Parafrankia discariae]
MTTLDAPPRTAHPGDGHSGPDSHDGAFPRLPLLVLCAAQLMVLLDGTIVNIALPTIAHHLRLRPDGAQWVITSYYLAFGGLLLLGGRAGDLLGRRRVLLAGMAVFTFASLLGGLASDGGQLLATRAVQGLGAAAIAPNVLALITTTFTDGRARAKALGVYAAMSSVGAATGLIAGGLLTEWVSWRWIFLVNVPIGLAVLAAGPRALREAPRRAGRFDLPGALSVTVGVVLLVYGVSRAGTEGWRDGWVSAALCGAAAALAVFAAVERGSRHPLLPARVIAERARSGAFIMAFGAGAGMFVLFFIGSQFLQGVLHTRPLIAGLEYVPFSATVLVTSQVVARRAGRTRPGWLIAAGGVLAASALVWLTGITAASSYQQAVLGPLVVCALGMGLVLVPQTMIAMARVEAADAGVTAGLLTTMQQLGGAVGVAVASTVAAATPAGPATALTDGYARALLATALLLVLTTSAAVLAIRPWEPRPAAR